MSPLSAIWNEVPRCEQCLGDPEIGPQLRSLPFFLPLPSNVEEPPYTYVFVAMEPSGNWLKTETEGRRRANEGYVNFATQLNDYVLVFAIQKYLLREGEGFCIMTWGSAPCLRATCARGRASIGSPLAYSSLFGAASMGRRSVVHLARFLETMGPFSGFVAESNILKYTSDICNQG